jgi:hypothetical protein
MDYLNEEAHEDLIDLGDATVETKGLPEGQPTDVVGFILPTGLSND